ncbi:uncharacterized protein [Nicotiana tomentosiformis]|uniref:uncharacterized protein n=1 Tax=Nicotiana tomentosiformis TaxID=4098 RepID=UPI00388C76A0
MLDNLPQDIEQLESQKKPNMEETEVVNLGSEEDVKETRISIHLEVEPRENLLDPLKYIFLKLMPTGKLAKWQILLSKFEIVYITQKAIKGQALADQLVENPVDEDYEPLTTKLQRSRNWGSPNFEIWTALSSIGKDKIPLTNNMAEYEVCILGIIMAVDMNVKELLVIGDSDLLIHQVQGEWSTKNVKILLYLHCIKDLFKKFMKIKFKHVPKIQNKFIDALATL